ncbi:hypothetical protein N9M41_03990 [Rhodopirellula sp.]|nr:hypothetical protein [Rhodopirellula sp.]
MSIKKQQRNTKTPPLMNLALVPNDIICKDDVCHETGWRYPERHLSGRHHSSRSGSALLMLIIALTMLISVYSTAIVKQAGQDLRGERERERIALLENAIHAVGEIESSETDFFKLPVEASNNDWVEVTKTMNKRDEIVFVAKFMHHGTELITIQRNLLSLQ